MSVYKGPEVRNLCPVSGMGVDEITGEVVHLALSSILRQR